MADPTSTRAPSGATGVLALASGEVIWGRGFGAEGQAVELSPSGDEQGDQLVETGLDVHEKRAL